MANDFNLILTIVNRGFSEAVMEAAREQGAPGGTILHGKGTGAALQKFHNITVEEEKEAVLIVSPAAKKNDIMGGILHAAGLASGATGVTFSLPVEDFFVLKQGENK
jgi:nitrogen regulatory protein PII